jgi:hypothetical protein
MNAEIYRGGFSVAIGRPGERAFLTGHHLVTVGRSPQDIPATGAVAVAEVAVAEVAAHDEQAQEAQA